MESKRNNLRRGYTTGACAAAAARAAALLLLQSEGGVPGRENLSTVDIPLPHGGRAWVAVHTAELRRPHDAEVMAAASVIKDAGDDPDITNGAEIAAEVRITNDPGIVITGGFGVGRVTKPGLAVPVGEPAINPVPRMMIREAVTEAMQKCGAAIPGLEVILSVPAGEELAKKTLNHRLGIIGGISILGTTGIVQPLSAAAWTATITASFSVARALGVSDVVLSTGRTSEKAHQRKYGLPTEAYVMMGDYTEYSLRDAAHHGFPRVHLCAQWAKMIKIARGTPQTHVRHGALEAEAARDYLIALGIRLPRRAFYTTTREILEVIRTGCSDAQPAMTAVCNAARAYCEQLTGGIPVSVHLVSYEGEIIAESE